MIDYHSRCAGIPNEITMKAYFQTIRDKLTLTYDPKFTSHPENIKTIYDSHVLEFMPSIFKDGRNIMDLAEEMIPQNGEIYNPGYWTNLARFAGEGGYDFNIVVNSSFPEHGSPVTLANMGSVAKEKYPEIHGCLTYNELLRKNLYDATSNRSLLFSDPTELNGTANATISIPQLFHFFDDVLNASSGYLLRGNWMDSVLGDYVTADDYYKRTDIYMSWHGEQYVNGELRSELRTEDRVILGGYSGNIGWYETEVKNDSGEKEVIQYDKWFRITLKIHSKSPFRYKYAVLCRAGYGDYRDESPEDYKIKGFRYCPYDFYLDGYAACVNVIHDHGEWCTGDQSISFEFKPGSYPGELWNMDIKGFRILIFPELPDRLSENINN